MAKITIKDHADKGTIHTAEFEPVRKAGDKTLGWATVSTDDVTLRFPAIVDAKYGRVITVSDWQAPWDNTDLADPTVYGEMVKTGQGTFLTEAGNPSDAFRAFL